ncbi:MAG TPA: DUF72 domain-containing protein [Verrucomicrobiae bacterium]|jgi:uncharacterized protein YecE (DUF72 family)
MATDIRIGTASWTDPGFIADWYPRGLPRSELLRWYAEHFNYTECNATFYALPTAKTAERWCIETPDDFVFDVKLPKVLSRHAMQAKFLPPDLRSKVSLKGTTIELTTQSEALITKRLLRELKPLIEAKKLGAFLLQMSPAFSPKKGHQLAELDSIRELLAPHQLAVELRNRDWVTGEQFHATIDYFTSRRLTFVMVDAPESEHFTVMPGLNAVTNRKLAYFRLHGRNEEGYVRGRTVAERFNHDYTEPELKQIEARVREVAKDADEIHIAANNNRSSYAPRTAEWLSAALIGDAMRKARQQEMELPFDK